LSKLFNFRLVVDDKGVEILRTSNLEFGLSVVLFNLNRLGVLASGNDKEILMLYFGVII